MERMSLDVNKMTKDQLRQHILMLAMQLTQLEEENKKLNEEIQRFKNNAMQDMREITELEIENKKLKSDLSECECSFGFENDEVGYRKRECKKLKEDVEYFRQIYLDLKKLCEKEGFMLSDEEVTKMFNLDEIK